MICTCRTSASSMCMLTPRYSSNSLVTSKWHSWLKFQSCRSCISEVRKTQKNPRHSFGNGKLSECWPRINSSKIRTQAKTLHKEKQLEIFRVIGVCFHFTPVKAILQSYTILPVAGDPKKEGCCWKREWGIENGQKVSQ